LRENKTYIHIVYFNLCLKALYNSDLDVFGSKE